MAVITLSWQLGCYGDRIAEDIADALQYRIVGKQELHDMLLQASEYFDDGGESGGYNLTQFSQVVEGEIQPDFFFRAQQNSSLYSSLLQSLLYKAASQDCTILKGFGAHVLLAPQPSVLAVRLQGSPAERLRVIQERHHLSPQAAKTMLKKDERTRMGFMHYLFHRELVDAQVFDLMITVDKFEPAAMTELIVGAARGVERKRPFTTEKRDELLALAFACRIQAIIQQMVPNIPGLDVKVGQHNRVTMLGNVVQDAEKIRIEERVRSIRGVAAVINRLTVGAPFGRKHQRPR